MSSPVSGTASIDGSTYHGIEQKSSVGPGRAVTINTNYGFYNWTGTDTTIITQYGSYSYAGGSGGNYNLNTFGKLSVRYNGAGTVTVSLLLDEVPNGATVSSGTSATLLIKPPSITYISNSWGTPTVTGVPMSAS